MHGVWHPRSPADGGDGLARRAVLEQIEDHVIEQARLVGTDKRRRRQASR
jgi:hypothetical protein